MREWRETWEWCLKLNYFKKTRDGQGWYYRTTDNGQTLYIRVKKIAARTWECVTRQYGGKLTYQRGSAASIRRELVRRGLIIPF